LVGFGPIQNQRFHFFSSPSPILSKPPNMMPITLLVARRIQCSHNHDKSPRIDLDNANHVFRESMEFPLRRLPGKPPIFGTAAPTQDCVSPCPTQTLCPLRGRAISAVKLMIQGRGRALWSARKWARQTFPGWARRLVRSLAPSRLPVLVPPQHPRHPHPSARLRHQRTYQDHNPPPSPVRVPPHVLHPERFKPWRRRQQPVRI